MFGKQTTLTVIPAEAGIHVTEEMDSRLRGNDNQSVEQIPARRIPGNDADKVVILDGFDDPLLEFDV